MAATEGNPEAEAKATESTSTKEAVPEEAGGSTAAPEAEEKTPEEIKIEALANVLEEKIAALEGGYGAACFGTGMAATIAVVSGMMKAGDHCVITNCVRRQ